jgi:ABC-type multidrug transport system ATPase subunit
MPMKISLHQLGKRFNTDWIFRKLDYTFLPSSSYAITGPNGSGKSTLLQVVASSTTHNEGKIEYAISDAIVPPEKVFRHIAISAPYLELIEEMTLNEFFSFHDGVKGFIKGFTATDAIREIGLQHAAEKQVRYYSSGMKQRVRLAQAIFSNASVILLDEPTSNLDLDGIKLYKHLVATFCSDRTVIISSNDITEYDFCEHVIDVRNYQH